MSTDEFIIDLFCRTGDVMDDLPKHPQAKLYLSEVVTLALLVALKGVGARAFYRWLVRDYQSLSPSVPERTWLFRVFVAHRAWRTIFWRNLRCWVSPMATGLNLCSRLGKSNQR